MTWFKGGGFGAPHAANDILLVIFIKNENETSVAVYVFVTSICSCGSTANVLHKFMTWTVALAFLQHKCFLDEFNP